MNNKRYRWLLGEIDKWVAEKLITGEIANSLRGRYAVEDRGWGKVIFSALGAILVGLGVILFFAYNWTDMPKFLKLGVVFAALLGSHGAGFWVSRRRPENRGLIEGLHLLGTMMFGAGIWLVAQIYHIDEHYPNALLIWSLGALGLAWTLPSVAQGILASVLISLWSGFEVFDFNSTNYWAPLLVAIGIIPLALFQLSRVLLFFALVALMFLLAVAEADEDLFITVTFFLSVIYIIAGLLVEFTGFSESRRLFRCLGFSVYLIFLYVFSFFQAANEISNIEFDTWTETAHFTGLLIPVVLGWLYVLAFLRTRLSWFWRLHWGLLAVPVVLVSAGALEWVALGWVVAVPMNLVFLAHCIVLILQGCREVNLKLVTIACLMFSVLVVSRYVDLFDSLLLRAVVFLALGAGLFVVGNFYSKRRKGLEERQT